MKRLALTLLATVAFAAPATAQGTQTATHEYEWIHVRVGDNQVGHLGSLFMGDITTKDVRSNSFSSQLQGVIRRSPNGEVILDCQLDVGGPDRDNIVQVGPFAQEAIGDAANLLANPFATNCVVFPESLTISCPFQGARVNVAPMHETFTHSGTINVTPPNRESFSQQGRRGPTRCDMFINGEFFQAEGHLTRITETRRGVTGAGLAPIPVWEEPTRWLRVEDTR